MTAARTRKRHVAGLLTRGCGIGRHGWCRESSTWVEADGTAHTASRYHCWVCGRIENRAPVGTFENMARQVVKPGMSWDDVGAAVERQFYGVPA